MPVAVNADSLATWFPRLLRTVAGWSDVVLRLHVEDQDHSAALLRAGTVLAAVRAGLGWGVVPQEQLGDDLSTGRLVRLGSRDRVDVPLYWQCWGLRSAYLERLTEAVRVAASGLRRRAVAARPGNAGDSIPSPGTSDGGGGGGP